MNHKAIAWASLKNKYNLILSTDYLLYFCIIIIVIAIVYNILYIIIIIIIIIMMRFSSNDGCFWHIMLYARLWA